MDINNLSKVILMPHVSEKSVMIADNVKQQTFKVAANATKSDVKKAIEKLFDVEVVNVNILRSILINFPGGHLKVPFTFLISLSFSSPMPFAARSRATPLTPNASGRFGVIAISMTVSKSLR